jgi:hypothetical protein
MGKERDKLLWQRGDKPDPRSDAEAYREYMRLRAEAGNLPPHMQKLIAQAHSDTAADHAQETQTAMPAQADRKKPESPAQSNEEKNVTPHDVLYRSPYKGWLVDQKFLQLTEEASTEVWTIIPLLTFSVQPGTEVFEGAHKAIQRGCKYKLFMPDTPEVHQNLAEYVRLHRPLPGQVEFILIPEEEYLFHTVVALYNPLSKDPMAIEYLPAEHLATWVRMDEDYTSRIVKTAQRLIKKYRNDSYVLTESILRHITDKD